MIFKEIEKRDSKIPGWSFLTSVKETPFLKTRALFVVEYNNLIRNVMLNYLYYLIVVFYKKFTYEFAFSGGCYNTYLLLINQKHDNKFYIHHHRHSIFFLYYHYPFSFGQWYFKYFYTQQILPLNNTFRGSFNDIYYVVFHIDQNFSLTNTMFEVVSNF